MTVNYDTVNSVALGFDPVKELVCLGERISDVHIKDRVLGGNSVVQGTGDIQFDRLFGALRPIGCEGPLIMQAFRDDEGLTIFRNQIDWRRKQYLEKML